LPRPKKKPDYDAEQVLHDLIAAVLDSYNSPTAGEEHKPLKHVAEELGITPLKVRKLLITAGAYQSSASMCVAALRADGKTIAQIQEATGLGRASVHGYLPYTKGLYNAAELSTDAERVRLYRARQAAVLALDGSSDALWEVVLLFAGFPFHTAKGLKFSYAVRGHELYVDRKEKSITRATVELAYQKVSSGRITGPKQLGAFGASYLYPMFVRFGIIGKPASGQIGMGLEC
jgi:hypothetical protein